MLDAAAVLALLAGKSRVTTLVGRYVGNEGLLALVDMGDQRVTVPFLTGMVPQINEPVHVWSVDGSPFMVGPTAPKPGVGVVTEVSGLTVSVETAFGTHVMQYAGIDPMVGETVGISWSSTPWCTVLSEAPTPPAPPPDPGPGNAQTQTATFFATDAGSTDRGSPRWWQAQPWASNTTYGAWFYGSQIADTIPDDAELVVTDGVPQFFFYASWVQRFGGLPRFTLHDAGGKGPIPGMSAYNEWDPGNGFQVPPDPGAWFTLLKTGAYVGVGLNQGGFNKFASLAQDGMSGAIKITWR